MFMPRVGSPALALVEAARCCRRIASITTLAAKLLHIINHIIIAFHAVLTQFFFCRLTHPGNCRGAGPQSGNGAHEAQRGARRHDWQPYSSQMNEDVGGNCCLDVVACTRRSSFINFKIINLLPPQPRHPEIAGPSLVRGLARDLRDEA